MNFIVIRFINGEFKCTSFNGDFMMINDSWRNPKDIFLHLSGMFAQSRVPKELAVG